MEHNKVHHVCSYVVLLCSKIIYQTIAYDAESHTHLVNAPENDNLLINPNLICITEG